MSKLFVFAITCLMTLPVNGYCEGAPDSVKRYGKDGRPGDVRTAEMRARHAAQGGGDAASTGADAGKHGHGGLTNRAASPDATAGGKPEENSRAGGRPGRTSGGMPGGGPIWLSDTPPMRGDGPRSGGAHGGGMGGMEMGGNRGRTPMKRLWPRAGHDPQKSGFAREDVQADRETLLVPPGKPEGEPLQVSAESHTGLAFEMPAQGYYRVYLTSRKLQGGMLNISVAKSEVANFGHGGDEEEQARALRAPRFLESAPIEIVRERKPGEKQFFQLKSGDEQAFIVLQKGLPLQGARVRFVSHQGWSKEAVSDEQGRVSFQVVRDYFPPWREFQKRFKATYLVIAEADAAESGSFKDQPYANVRYQATLSGNYMPSADDYMSYAWGLGIGLLILLFCGVSVYLYRRRRIKPFQEVRFDESK